MTESITAQDTSKPGEVPDSSISLDKQAENQTQQAIVSVIPAHIIWTPRFIVLFLIMLMLGLSVESLLTQAWASHLIHASWVLLSETFLTFGCLIVIALISRSRWIRLGAIFGSIWAIFTSINLFIPVNSLDPSTPIFSLLNAIICSSLFGTFICFSIERTFLTKNLRDLSSQVVRRLSGVRLKTSAVFNLSTQFRGGKTQGVHKDGLVSLGTAPLDDPLFRAAMFEQLGELD